MNIKLDIPSGFFEGEERSGYYVSPEMKRVWAVQLDLIAEFARVCEKHGLKWQMAYGTLLGAVRHKGFIPWDDDVDVTMMRADYERLLEVADEFRSPYRLETMYNTSKGYDLVFAKLHNESTTMIEGKTASIMKAGGKAGYSQGIFIDIFPVDDIPDDEAEADRFIRRARTLHLMSAKLLGWTLNYYPTGNILKRSVKSALHRALTLMKVDYFPHMRRFDEFIRSYRNPDSRRVSCLVFCGWHTVDDFKAKETWDRSLLAKTVQLPFEMLSLPAPAHYDEILTLCFGDWRTPLITHTHGTLYDTEKPYTDYINKSLTGTP